MEHLEGRDSEAPGSSKRNTITRSSHSACLRVAAGFARGEISPELATTRCHGTKSGLRVGSLGCELLSCRFAAGLMLIRQRDEQGGRGAQSASRSTIKVRV
jgi:hypothetical protein